MKFRKNLTTFKEIMKNKFRILLVVFIVIQIQQNKGIGLYN
jgi:hypothetical protein